MSNRHTPVNRPWSGTVRMPFDIRTNASSVEWPRLNANWAVGNDAVMSGKVMSSF